MENKYPPIVQVTNTGQIIGPIPYKLAHPKDPNTKGIRHSTSNVLIFRDESYKELYVTRRSKKVNKGGVLEISVGGHAIWIEKEGRAQLPLENAIKELNEELFGKKPLPKELRYLEQISSFAKDLRLNDPEYVHLFLGCYAGPFNLSIEEISEGSFRDLNTVHQQILATPENYTKSAKLYLDKFFETLKT